MNIVKASLKNYTSMRIGGEAEMVVVKTEAELVDALMYAKENDLQVHILGLGTNTVFGEDLKNFLIIKIEIKGIVSEPSTNDEQLLTVGAGEIWDDVVKFSVSNSLWGIENLSYIPGTAGAAPVQNIGAYGTEIKDTLVSIKAFDTKTNSFVILTNNDCNFSYRDSIFKHEKNRYIITTITLELSKKFSPHLSYKPLDTLLEKKDLKIEEIRDIVIKTRTQKLPDYNLYPNVGSFFKNPIVEKSKVESLKVKYPSISIFEFEDRYKVSAAWLIEHVAKMKGEKDGNIGTWPNQSLVLVNYGMDTKLEELKKFSQKIKNIIKEKTGIELAEEVNMIIN